MAPTSRPRSRVLPALRTASLVLLLPLGAGGCGQDTAASTVLITALPDPAWVACAGKNACEARWLTCRGWIAVNREHGQQAEAWYVRENSAYLDRAECDGRPRVQPPAFCRANRCTLE